MTVEQNGEKRVIFPQAGKPGLVKLILVAAPSGAGKSTFVQRICQEDPRLEDVITYTTRPMRDHESPGNPYHFLSVAEFENRIAQGFFVEWARVHGHYYGSSWESLHQAWRANRVVIMDIDVQGVQSYRQAGIDGMKTIFILTPTPEVLKERLMRREKKWDAQLALRWANSFRELAQSWGFDAYVINDEFNASYDRFKRLVQNWLQPFDNL